MAGTGLGLLDTAMLISVRSAMHATAGDSRFVCLLTSAARKNEEE
jgi:hypothetical protein